MFNHSSTTQAVKQVAIGLFGVAAIVWILCPALFEPLRSIVRSDSPTSSITSDDRAANKPTTRVYTPPVDGDDGLVEADSARRERLQKLDDHGVGLGKELFAAAERLSRELPEISQVVQSVIPNRLDAARSHQGGLEPITGREWQMLMSWFRDHYADVYHFEDLGADVRRFESLENHPLTEAEAEEVRLLVEKCGKVRLRLPFDAMTNEFHFISLPDDSPEVAMENYKRLFRLLTNREWSYQPANPRWQQESNGDR